MTMIMMMMKITIKYTQHLTRFLPKLLLPQQCQVCISNILPRNVEQQQQQRTRNPEYEPQHFKSRSNIMLSWISLPESCNTTISSYTEVKIKETRNIFVPATGFFVLELETEMPTTTMTTIIIIIKHLYSAWVRKRHAINSTTLSGESRWSCVKLTLKPWWRRK